MHLFRHNLSIFSLLFLVSLFYSSCCDLCDLTNVICVEDSGTYSSLQSAINSVTDESLTDTIYLKKDIDLELSESYNALSVSSSVKMGSKSNPITISSYPGEIYKISADYKTTIFSSEETNYPSFFVIKQKYWRLTNVNIYVKMYSEHEKYNGVSILAGGVSLENINVTGEFEYENNRPAMINIYCFNDCDDEEYDDIFITDLFYDIISNDDSTYSTFIKIDIDAYSWETTKVDISRVGILNDGSSLYRSCNYFINIGDSKGVVIHDLDERYTFLKCSHSIYSSSSASFEIHSLKRPTGEELNMNLAKPNSDDLVYIHNNSFSCTGYISGVIEFNTFDCSGCYSCIRLQSSKFRKNIMNNIDGRGIYFQSSSDGSTAVIEKNVLNGDYGGVLFFLLYPRQAIVIRNNVIDHSSFSGTIFKSQEYIGHQGLKLYIENNLILCSGNDDFYYKKHNDPDGGQVPIVFWSVMNNIIINCYNAMSTYLVTSDTSSGTFSSDGRWGRNLFNIDTMLPFDNSGGMFDYIDLYDDYLEGDGEEDLFMAEGSDVAGYYRLIKFFEGVDSSYTPEDDFFGEKRPKYNLVGHVGEVTCEDSKTSFVPEIGNCTVCGGNYVPMTNCSICVFGYDIEENCNECLHGRNASSLCLECMRNYKDSNCTECKFGWNVTTECELCEFGRDESYSCEKCLENYDEDLDCKACINGYDLSKNCLECLPNFNENSNCTICEGNYNISTNCEDCLAGWDLDELCSKCKEGYDINSDCTDCTGNYDVEKDCKECLAGFDIDSDCLDCLPNFDENLNCTICEGNYNISTNCEECLDGWDLDESCYKCKEGYDISSDCTECSGNYDIEKDCKECLIGFGIDSDCEKCLDGLDYDKDCKECKISGYDIDSNPPCSTCLSGLTEINDECVESSNSYVAYIIGGIGGFFVVLVFVVLLCLIVVFCVVFLCVKKKKRGNEKMEINELDDVTTNKNEDKIVSAKLKVSSELFEIDASEVKLQKSIGKGGGNATVYLASWNNETIAYKVFEMTIFGSESQDFEDFEKEVKLMASISHPNILRFYGCTLKVPRIGIVMEFCENGELGLYLSNNEVSMKQKWEILCGVAKGLNYLHKRNVIHRDVKPENVLLDEKIVPKLIDFGISRIIERNSTLRMTRRVGTAYFMSPEVVRGGHYDQKIDVFSFAITAYMCLYNNWNPYGNVRDINEKAIEFNVASNPEMRPKFPENSLPEWAIELLKTMWSHDPNDRPEMDEIVKIISENSLKKPEQITESFQKNEIIM